MFGLRRRRTPTDVATELLAWPQLVDEEDCELRLPDGLDPGELSQWLVESRVLVASGVVHGCRIAVDQGSRNDALQQAIYDGFVADIGNAGAVEFLTHLLGERTETYRIIYDELLTGKRDAFNTAAMLGVTLGEFITGRREILVGDFFALSAMTTQIMGAKSVSELDLEQFEDTHPVHIFPALALRALRDSINTASAAKWA